MGWFNFHRHEGFPTQYAAQHSAASVDVVTAGLILALVILGISLLSVLPSYNGKRRWIFFFQVVINLIIGGIIVVVNYGQNWEVGSVTITSPYKAGSAEEIKADLGIHIGLRGINITLEKVDHPYHDSSKQLQNEHINYNEHFSWEGTQGRFGFGYYAARIAQDFRAAVYNGLPLPIIQLAEYFTFDGEGIRFGRHYRLAGWYSHILMWTAFTSWLISSILLGVVVRYGAIFLMVSGVFQFLAILVWYFTRNFVELQVPYESGHDEVILRTVFGADFYLVLFNTILCVLLGFTILWFNSIFPDEMCQFFGIDPLTIYDEYHLTKDEIAKGKEERHLTEPNVHRMESGLVNLEEDSSNVIRRNSDDQGQLVLRRRTDATSRLFQKSFKVKPKILPRLRSNPLSRGEVIKEEGEMSVRTPLLANTSSPLYANDPGIHQFGERDDAPPLTKVPPEAPPRTRSGKTKFTQQ